MFRCQAASECELKNSMFFTGLVLPQQMMTRNTLYVKTLFRKYNLVPVLFIADIWRASYSCQALQRQLAIENDLSTGAEWFTKAIAASFMVVLRLLKRETKRFV